MSCQNEEDLMRNEFVKRLWEFSCGCLAAWRFEGAIRLCPRQETFDWLFNSLSGLSWISGTTGQVTAHWKEGKMIMVVGGE